MTHIITIKDGEGSFECTGDIDSYCHRYPGCDCDNYGHEEHRGHESVKHETCLYTTWFNSPEAINIMWLENTWGTNQKPNNAIGEIGIDREETDEPLWSFLDMNQAIENAELARKVLAD